MNYTKLTIYIFLFLSAFAVVFPTPAFAANSSIFTIEAWVRPTTSIATKSVVAKAEEIRLVTDGSGNPICQIKHTTWQTAATSSAAISVDTWSHIACSYDKVNLKVFVNGVEKGSTALAVAVDDTVADLNIGKDASVDAVYGEFEGKIDDVRFYNYARSAKQIMQDLNAGHPSTGSPVGSQVGYWKFDEGYGDTANDSSPHNNDGNLAGSCPGDDTCPSWTNSGKFGKALSFDGGDYVDCGDPADGSLDFRTGDFSLEFWAKTSSNSQQYIFHKYAGGNDGWYSDLEEGTNNARLKFGNGTSYETVDTSSLDINIDDGNWHHYVWVRGNSNTYFYTDGTEDYNTATTAYEPDTSSNLLIGNTATSFTGTIDEVKIYNYALTEDEVRVDYNQGKAIVLGATGTEESDGTTPSFSANREYCVPGDTTSCDPPVAEWNFNEQTGASAFDTSENNNTGAITNATWTPSGKFGSALSFDGDGDYVDCGADTSLNMGLGPFTMEVWIKTSSASGQIIDKYAATGGGGQMNFQISSSKLLGLAWNGADGIRLAGDTNIADNNWHHAVFVVDSDGTSGRLYLDGSEDGSETGATAKNTTSDGSLLIGKDTAPTYFNGSIDQVKIYDYARTPAQVAWSYNRGKPVAHWRFDECQGNTAHDESGNSNTGIITIGANAPQTSVGTCTDGLSTSAWYNGVDGKINSAMSFDGDDDYVNCGAGSTLNFGMSNLTIEGWVKTSVTMKVMVGKDVAIYWGNGFQIFPATNGVYVEFSNGVDHAYANLTNKPCADGQWHYLVVVINRDTDLISAFVDGEQLVDTLDISGVTGNITNATDLLIGKNGSGYPFNGLIDEVKVFNYALTAEQIKMEYNAGSAVHFK